MWAEKVAERVITLTSSAIFIRTDVAADVSDIILDDINLNMPECEALKVQSKSIPELVKYDNNDNTSDNSSVVTLSSPEEPIVQSVSSLLAQVSSRFGLFGSLQ